MTIAVLVTARPSWAKLSPVIPELRKIGFEVDLIGAAYALTHSAGIVDPAFRPTTLLASALEQHTGGTMAYTTALLLTQLTSHLERTRPAALLLMADRHETIAAAIAGAYVGVPVVHCQGGEMSGGIDQRVRYANTALSDWHCVANDAAYARVVLAGAYLDRVWITGCPSIDVARVALADAPVTASELSQYGVGQEVDPQTPFTLLMWHPTADMTPEAAITEWLTAWSAATDRGLPVVSYWPGPDVGHDSVVRYVRSHGYEGRAHWIRSLPPARFLKLMSQAACMVGNSSALIRERCYTGPADYVLIGQRQRHRPTVAGPGATLYGDGHAAPRIAEVCRAAAVRP